MHKRREELADAFELPQATWRSEDWDDMHVSFEVYREDLDARPLLAPLPDGQCQCPHWGYVLKGRLQAIYGDRSEVIAEGEAYYLPPGHTIVVDAGTELIELSPREAFAAHLAEVERARRS